MQLQRRVDPPAKRPGHRVEYAQEEEQEHEGQKTKRYDRTASRSTFSRSRARPSERVRLSCILEYVKMRADRVEPALAASLT